MRARLKSGPAIARGNGRAYGDCAVSAGNTISMRHFNRMLSFDEGTGRLVVEAGVLLGDVVAAFLPRGWFPAVTPGTKYVTIGGMVAADVHGKSHHRRGSFGGLVDWVDIMAPDGTVTRCSSHENSELFEWTVGGMGLTGVILRVAFRLSSIESGFIRQTLIPARDLAAAISVFEQGQDATYSVAWIDCLGTGSRLGRSIVMLGEHATRAELPAWAQRNPFPPARATKFSVPFDAPTFALNGLAVRAFNALYYRNGKRKAGVSYVDWDRYFYPLDAVLGWNRIYGRKGFAQFQCAVPLDQARAALTALLKAVSTARQGSFLAVLKCFGAQESRFSFPMEGYTLALDFPVCRKSLALMEQLDQITIDHGGRFYLAKDSRMTAATLKASDGRVEAFAAMRRTTGNAAAFASAQSERLSL